MTIFHSDEVLEIDEDGIVSSLSDKIEFDREEIIALLKECEHSYISYKNPLARQVIKKMIDFVE